MFRILLYMNELLNWLSDVCEIVDADVIIIVMCKYYYVCCWHVNYNVKHKI